MQGIKRKSEQGHSSARKATLRALGALILFLGVAGWHLAAKPLPADERLPLMERIRPGLRAEQVRQLLGAPKRVARQILYHRYFEQWVYDAPVNMRVEFECRRGQEAQVQSVQAIKPLRP